MEHLLENGIRDKLLNQGVDLVEFVDIHQLPKEQIKGYLNAGLFGILLSPEFLQEVSNTPD